MLIKVRKLIHPILLKILPSQRSFELITLNNVPQIEGAKLFAMNHSNCHDAPIANESIVEHVFILAGKQPLKIIDRLFLFLNGTIYIDRKKSESKKRGTAKIVQMLNRGESVLMYPEGTWNLTPSKPTIPLYWGIVDIAKNTGVPIIPMVAEYHTDCCYVKYGNPLYIDKDMDKQQGIDKVTDSLATLKWDIWEMFPVEKRSEQLEKEFEMMIQSRLNEYPKLNWEYERTIVRR